MNGYSRIRPRLILPAILFLAITLRLLGISDRPIWYDESFSLLMAGHEPAEIVTASLGDDSNRAAEEHPPVYYFMLHGWFRVFGNSIVSGRALSILASIGTIIISYALANAVGNRKAAAFTAILLATSPFQIHYSQEIRMYAWLAFWLAGAALAFCIASRTHKPGWWIIFAFSSALAQYTHTLAVFFLIPLAMIPLWRKDWRNLRAVTLAGAGALLLFLPWLVQVPAQIAKVQTSYWMEPPGLDRVFSALTTYVTNLPLPDGWLVVGLFVTLSTFSLLTLETAKSIRRRDPYSIEISWFAYMAIAPLVLLLLFSQWIPVFTERALLPSVVFFCLWAGGIIAQARGPRIMKVSVTACLLIGAVIGIYQHLAYTGFPYVPRSASTILQDMQSGDAVVHSSKLSALPMIYQQPALTQRFVADPPDSDSDTLSPATLAVFGLSADPQVDEACHGADRVWFVIFTRSVEEYREAGADTHPHMEWLASHFIHQSGWVFSGLEIHLFSMNP